MEVCEQKFPITLAVGNPLSGATTLITIHYKDSGNTDVTVSINCNGQYST
jgi:hypothetical protein